MSRPPRAGRDRSDSDPFSAALRPPPDETPEQREHRLRAEEEARKRSENIDAMLRHDRKRSARKKTVKVLLLGQSESGKSTTLKRESSPRFMCPFLPPEGVSARPTPRFPHPDIRQFCPVSLGRVRGLRYKLSVDKVSASRAHDTSVVPASLCTLLTCHIHSLLSMIAFPLTADRRRH